jgi:hypothetical protein
MNDSKRIDKFKLSINPVILDKGDHFILQARLDSIELAVQPIINGIRIYQQKVNKFETLTPNKILISRKSGKNLVNYVIHKISRDSIYRFKFVPVNIFGTEGEAIQLIFDPQNYSGKSKIILNKPQLFQSDDKVGFNLSWETEITGKESIIGFIVTEGWYKDFDVLSDTLHAESDKCQLIMENLTTTIGTYRFRVIGLRSGSQVPVYSNEVFVDGSSFEDKFPAIDFKVDVDYSSQPVKLQLIWVENNLPSDRYGIFSIENEGPVLEKIVKGKTSAELVVFNPLGELKYLQLMQLDSYDRILNVSDTVMIEIPSQHIPPVYIERISRIDSEIKLYWNAPVPMPYDLAGYELYIDGELSVNQAVMGKDTNECNLNYKQAGSHLLSLVAFSRGGKRSKSNFRPITLNIKN